MAAKPVSQRSLVELQRDLAHVEKMEDVVAADQAQSPSADFSFMQGLLASGRKELEEEIGRKAGQP